jgi:hypothetical protein
MQLLDSVWAGFKQLDKRQDVAVEWLALAYMAPAHPEIYESVRHRSTTVQNRRDFQLLPLLFAR